MKRYFVEYNDNLGIYSVVTNNQIKRNGLKIRLDSLLQKLSEEFPNIYSNTSEITERGKSFTTLFQDDLYQIVGKSEEQDEINVFDAEFENESYTSEEETDDFDVDMVIQNPNDFEESNDERLNFLKLFLSEMYVIYDQEIKKTFYMEHNGKIDLIMRIGPFNSYWFEEDQVLKVSIKAYTNQLYYNKDSKLVIKKPKESQFNYLNQITIRQLKEEEIKKIENKFNLKNNSEFINFPSSVITFTLNFRLHTLQYQNWKTIFENDDEDELRHLFYNEIKNNYQFKGVLNLINATMLISSQINLNFFCYEINSVMVLNEYTKPYINNQLVSANQIKNIDFVRKCFNVLSNLFSDTFEAFREGYHSGVIENKRNYNNNTKKIIERIYFIITNLYGKSKIMWIDEFIFEFTRSMEAILVDSTELTSYKLRNYATLILTQLNDFYQIELTDNIKKMNDKTVVEEVRKQLSYLYNLRSSIAHLNLTEFDGKSRNKINYEILEYMFFKFGQFCLYLTEVIQSEGLKNDVKSIIEVLAFQNSSYESDSLRSLLTKSKK